MHPPAPAADAALVEAGFEGKAGTPVLNTLVHREATRPCLHNVHASQKSKLAALRERDEFSHLQWTELTEPLQASALLKAVAASSSR